MTYPAELLERADLANQETSNGPDQAANSIAELEFGYLGQGLTVGDDDNADIAEKLDRLQEVHAYVC